MSKKLSLTILKNVAAVGMATVAVGSAIAADHISVHHMNYEEYGDKIKAGDNIVSFEKSFGLDWTLNAEIGYDTVSGASPAWGPTTPISGAQDILLRNGKNLQAQAKTSEVIRAGYDPHRSGYVVQPFELEDTRYSTGASLTYRDSKRNEWTFGTNVSKEEDYRSTGVNGQVLFYADSRKNRSYTVGLSALFDETLAFQKYSDFGNTQKWEDIFTGNVELGLSQIFTPNLYTTFTLYGGYKSGYLSNHYLTVLREIDINDNGQIEEDEVFLGQDSRPDQRVSGGVNIQGFYHLNSRIVIRPRYKFFADDWGVISHQVGAKMNIKLADWVTVAPGYHWYKQQGADFYRDPEQADPTFAATGYATSDLRLGDFVANAYEFGVSFTPFAKWRFNALAAYYEQSNGFESQWWAVGATYEF